VLDSRDGGVRWARAGHLPPLVVGRGGRARYLDGAQGCVLGVPNAPPCTEGATSIEAGDTVLLYTDGLVERRDETLDDGLARLAAVAGAAAGAGGSAEDFASAVVGGVLGGAAAGDDVALVVTRFGGPGV
jgi:serine phosphatase RsbU (regulator of sigma subunit)